MTRGAGQAFEGKVSVVLGPYKSGAIAAEQVPKTDVTDEAVDAALKKRKSTTNKFERINFTGSGARLGLTVKIDMEAKWGAGHAEKGMPIKGTKMAGYVLELTETQPEPWRQFVTAITERGMGQMEQKTFAVSFPEDYAKKDFAGKTVDFTVLVREIGEMRPIALDLRPDAEQLAELKAELKAAVQQRSNEAVDKAIREALLESSQVDTDAKTKSVSWAKFGPESERALKWNCIQEEVARVEGIPFAEVGAFLRAQADVHYLKA